MKFSVPYVTRYTSPTQEYSENEKPDKETHKANLADIVSRISEGISVFNTAKSLYRAEAGLRSANILAGKAREYSKLFNVKLPKLPAIPTLKEDRRAKLAAFDAKRDERSKAIRDGRDAKWEEQRRLDALSREEKVIAWRAGSDIRFYSTRDNDGFAILRVKGSNVETSMGVSVPINGLAGAGRLLRFLTACKDAGRPYHRNWHTEHIGNFTVESFQPLLDDQADVSPTGEWILIAGCHRITWSEVLSIADSVRSADKEKTEPIS